MKLIFEKSVPGRGCSLLPPCDVPETALPGFTGVHPLAPAHTTLGCQEVLEIGRAHV